MTTHSCRAVIESAGSIITRQLSGMTDVDIVIVREGKSAKGRVLSGERETIGKQSLEETFTKSVKAIEARSDAICSEGS